MTISQSLDCKCTWVWRNKSLEQRQCFPTLSPRSERKKDVPTNLQLNNGENTIQFINKIKYLGSLITPCLTENAEIEAWIKNVKSQLGMLTHFFGWKDIELHMKYWIYITGPLNTLLWGYKSSKMSDSSCTKLCLFHHSAIRWILGIWVDEVLECQISNEQVRMWFENIPTIDEFITRQI